MSGYLQWPLDANAIFFSESIFLLFSLLNQKKLSLLKEIQYIFSNSFGHITSSLCFQVPQLQLKQMK